MASRGGPSARCSRGRGRGFMINQTAAAAAPDPESQQNRGIPMDLLKTCSLKNIKFRGTVTGTDHNDEEKTLVFSNYNSTAELFEPITEDGELKKRMIKAGDGKRPPVNGRVWITYVSHLEHNPEPFESCLNEDEPYTFILFQHKVLPVLEFGTATMTLGEKSHFLASPNYAYGNLGIPDKVPPNSAMIFEIELVDFKAIGPLPIYTQPTPGEWAQREFIQIKRAVEAIKAKANERCKKGNYSRALSGYNRAKYILQRPKIPSEPESVNAERNSLLFAVYNNMAMCHLQSHDYENVRLVGQKALALPRETVGNRCKLYYRLAKAEFELGHFEDSKKYLDLSLKLEPANKECRTLYETVLERLDADSKVSNDLYKKMAAKLTISEKKEENNAPTGSGNNSESHDENEEEEYDECEEVDEEDDVDIFAVGAEAVAIAENYLRQPYQFPEFHDPGQFDDAEED